MTQPNEQPNESRRSTRFDALKLSASGESLSGAIDAASLPRLRDRLASGAGDAPVAWRIAGALDGQRRPALALTLSGSVPLVCQRCLQAFSAAVDQTTELLLARSEAELASLDVDEVEVVLAMERLDPLMLVEDELLLSLPFAPRHPDGECDAAFAAADDAAARESRPSPFGQLGGLKKPPT